MELGALKPFLASLALPPVSLLLMALLGLLLAWRNQKKTGLALASLSVLLLGCSAATAAQSGWRATPCRNSPR
jgi:CHASE2 domain-containing sensor protein